MYIHIYIYIYIYIYISYMIRFCVLASYIVQNSGGVKLWQICASFTNILSNQIYLCFCEIFKYQIKVCSSCTCITTKTIDSDTLTYHTQVVIPFMARYFRLRVLINHYKHHAALQDTIVGSMKLSQLQLSGHGHVTPSVLVRTVSQISL